MSAQAGRGAAAGAAAGPGSPATLAHPSGMPIPLAAGSARPVGSALAAASTQTAVQGARMPSQLRRLRAAAPIACALTGIAASGLIGVSGYEVPASSVIEQQRHVVAAQHEFSRADLAAGQIMAERVIAARPAGSSELDAQRTRVTAALGTSAAEVVAAASSATSSPQLISSVRGLTSYQASLAESLLAPAASTTKAARAYGQLGGQASSAVLTPLATVATANLDRLTDGAGVTTRAWGRPSVLVVGGLSTLGLALASWWLARKTHRIVNPGLAAAGVITAGLTLLAVNPGLLIGDGANDAVAQARSTQSLTTELHDLRRAELGGLLPGGDPSAAQSTWTTQAAQISQQLRLTSGAQPRVKTDPPAPVERAWADYQAAHAKLITADSPSRRIEQLRAGDTALSDVFKAAATASSQAANTLDGAVGRPALIGSGGALAAGLLAAMLAWMGIGRRLQEYR